MLNIEDLEDRRAYLIDSRNLWVGFWSARNEAFYGIREKFSARFVDVEYHWKDDPPTGTARATQALDLFLPEGVQLRTVLGLVCQECRQPVEQVWEGGPSFREGGRCVGNRHLEETDCTPDKPHFGMWEHNDALFNLIDHIDQDLKKKRKEEYRARVGTNA